MTSLAWEVIIALAGLVLSMVTSAFVAGMYTGQLRADVHNIIERLAKIEGMFTLRLKQDD